MSSSYDDRERRGESEWIAAWLFGATCGGGPVFGGIIAIGFALGATSLVPYLIAAGIVAGLVGVCAALGEWDAPDKELPQAAAFFGWVVGIPMAISAGIIAIVRAFG